MLFICNGMRLGIVEGTVKEDAAIKCFEKSFLRIYLEIVCKFNQKLLEVC